MATPPISRQSASCHHSLQRSRAGTRRQPLASPQAWAAGGTRPALLGFRVFPLLPEPGPLKSRTGIRETDSFHSSVGHEDQAARRGMCSDARGFHGARHCAVHEREAKRGSGGPHPSLSVSVTPQPPSGAPGEGSKCGRPQTPQSLGQLGGPHPMDLANTTTFKVC